MKKLIFLLLTAVVFAGIVSAWDTAHPPGGFDPEMILAEYGVREGVVTQPTVLVLAVETIAQPIRFQAVMAYNDTVIQPQRNGEIPIIDTGRSKAVFAESANKLHC